MIVTSCQVYLLVWACDILGLPKQKAFCIGNVVNGKLKAVVVYCGFSGKSCQIHIASQGSHWMTKSFLFAAFDYPFNKLGLKVILATISGKNKKSLRLSRHLGFQEIATIPDAHDDGDLVIFGMRPESCTWLGMKNLGV